VLRNHDYRQYYLDYMEHMLDTEFNPRAIAAQIGSRAEDGLWHRVRQAAYLESDTPYGRPFTGRRYSNDEVYQSGCHQRELRHGKKTIEGIVRVHLFKGRVISGLFGHAARPRSGMLAGS
jgi:hypothetical protein